MSLSEAVSRIESHILEYSEDDADSLRVALRDIVSFAMPSQVQSICSEQQAYALQILHSLSRRSDVKYKTYFRTLHELGVPLDQLHSHIASSHELDIFGHFLLHSEQHYSDDHFIHDAINSALKHRTSPLRMEIQSVYAWPRVCHIITGIAKLHPFVRVRVSSDCKLLSSTASFLELIPSIAQSADHSTLMAIVLHVGQNSLVDPAFLSAIWTIAGYHILPTSLACSTPANVASLHLLSPVLQQVFSTYTGPLPSAMGLPSCLLSAKLSRENIDLFCFSAQQLIEEAAKSDPLAADETRVVLPLLMKPSMSAGTVSSVDDSSSSISRVADFESIHIALNDRARTELQMHLVGSAAEQLQVLAVMYASFLLNESGDISGIEGVSTSEASRKRKLQHESASGPDSWLKVLHFAWTGCLLGSHQCKIQASVAAALARAVVLDAKAVSSGIAAPDSAAHAALTQYWQQQAASFSSTVAMREILALMRLCLAFISCVAVQGGRRKVVSVLMEAYIDVCRAGLATQSGKHLDLDDSWRNAEFAAGYTALVMLIHQAETLAGHGSSSQYLSEMSDGTDLKVLSQLLVETCSQEGAPLCDYLRTLPLSDAASALHRIQNLGSGEKNNL